MWIGGYEWRGLHQKETLGPVRTKRVSLFPTAGAKAWWKCISTDEGRPAFLIFVDVEILEKRKSYPSLGPIWASGLDWGALPKGHQSAGLLWWMCHRMRAAHGELSMFKPSLITQLFYSLCRIHNSLFCLLYTKLRRLPPCLKASGVFRGTPSFCGLSQRCDSLGLLGGPQWLPWSGGHRGLLSQRTREAPTAPGQSPGKHEILSFLCFSPSKGSSYQIVPVAGLLCFF